MSDALPRVMLTVFGLGRLRWAPGTWGSAAPVAFALGMIMAGASPRALDAALVAIALLFGAACVVFGARAEAHFGRTDPPQVVADEVAGQSVALLLLPWHEPSAWPWNLALAGAAFVAFRFFDVLKPPPIRQVQHLHGGWGILLDDLLAGLAALGVTHLAFWLLR